MRNLKRALSLALAAVMVLGMMVIGASAVSYNDFGDRDEIVNKDAVSMLTTLGVINGDGAGNYNPKGTVTREQMAKMISVIMNKGVDNNNLYLGVNSGLVDLNTAAEWAQGHINYCYTTGIIAGDGAGHFFPNLEVTAVGAAKMLLVAIGYDPKIEGLEGEQWSIKTSALASKLGIFDNYKGNVNAVLNRDDAALLMYNALDVEMIETYDGKYAQSHRDSRTILSAMYGVIKVEGVVVANEWATLNSSDPAAAMKAGKTTISNPEGIFSTTTNTAVSQDSNVKTQTFNVSSSVDMLGKSVTMYIKKATILANSTVYGEPVISAKNIVVETGNAIAVADDTYDDLLSANGLVDHDAPYFWNFGSGKNVPNGYGTDKNEIVNKKGATLTVIDNDGDGEVDYVLSLEKTLSDVTNVSSKNDTTTVRTLGTLDNDDVVAAEDLAKGDVVLFVQYGGRTYLEIPETVTGEMSHYNVKGTEKYMTVDGERYKEDGLKTVARTDVTKFFVMGCEAYTDSTGKTRKTTPASGDIKGVEFDVTYNFYLDDYGNVIAFEEVEGTAKNYALILDSAFSTNMLNTDAQVKVLLPDGTTKTFPINWSASVKNWKSGKMTDDDAVAALKMFLGTDDGRAGTHGWYPAAGAAAGNLISYTLNEDGEMTIKLPELAVGDVVDATKTAYTESAGYFVTNSELLAAILEKGDVEVALTRTNAGLEKNGKYGIDADTVVYYFDGEDGAVVTGYDDMAKKISTKTGKAKDIDQYGVHVSIIDFDNDDVANVMVLYTSQAKFGNDNFVFVMPEYNRYSNTFTYTIVNADGSMETVKSDEDLRDWLGKEGCVLKMDMDGKKAEFHKVTASDPVAVGFVRVTGTKYVNVFATAKSGAIKNPNTDNEWLDLDMLENAKRLANKDEDLIYDIENTDIDDEQATGTTFADGQYGYVVYDGNTVKAAYIVKTYLTEDPTNPGHSTGSGDVKIYDVYLDTTDAANGPWINAEANTEESANITFNVYRMAANGKYYLVSGGADLKADGYGASGANPTRYAAKFNLKDGEVYRIEVLERGEVIFTSNDLMADKA